MTVEIITLLLRLGIVIMAGIVAPAFKRWIDAKTDNEKLNQLKQAAETAVYAAEQIYTAVADNDSYQDERRKFAIKAISVAAGKLGLALTDSEIEEIMEAAVQELNIVKYGGVTHEDLAA